MLDMMTTEQTMVDKAVRRMYNLNMVYESTMRLTSGNII